MTVVETDLACARVKVKHHRQSSRSNGITEKETKKSAFTPQDPRRVTDRLNGESPVDWFPDPFPSTNHDSRDGITQNIQSHRPNRSTLDRSLSNAIVRSRARARASVVASVVAHDDATEETMGGYDIPKAFSFVVTARARRSHRPASSIARPPRAPIVSPSRALARSRRPSRRVSRGTTTTVDRRKKTLYVLGPWSP